MKVGVHKPKGLAMDIVYSLLAVLLGAYSLDKYGWGG